MRDKDADAMLAELAATGSRLVATTSSNDRALPAEELAALAERHFAEVEIQPDPAAALAHARQYGPVLVTGSLYLLGDLARNDA